jgi:FkbM family methyltransferase
MFAFRDVFKGIPDLHIVDVGASPIEEQPIYQSILDQGGYHLTGFEPNPVMYQQLVSQAHPQWTFYPYAIGDGNIAELKICSSPGMSSLLEPDLELLGHFHGFGEWGKVIERRPLTTRRLDDISEVKDIDFLKLDVQGSELAVLENATEQLRHTLVAHVETLFVPFYKDQPLFGEIDLCMRRAGFMFHRFGPLVSRVFQPLVMNNDLYAGLNQILWSDAVYVKSFVHFNQMQPAELLKTARILHDIYGSFDLANLALIHVDRQLGSNRQGTYLNALMGNG